MTEIALGKLAGNKATAPEVRAYADQLVEDHTSVDGTVIAMAKRKAYTSRARTGEGSRPNTGVGMTVHNDRRGTLYRRKPFTPSYLGM
jgi:hypothetical protein